MIELREVTLTFPPPRARSIRERLNGLRRRDGSVEDDRAVTALRDIRLLVPPGDAAALAEGLTTLLSNPEAAARMGQAARQTVEARYTIEHVAEQWLDAYHHVLASR